VAAEAELWWLSRHVGDGDNLRWTGFDATNVLLHRLNVALAGVAHNATLIRADNDLGTEASTLHLRDALRCGRSIPRQDQSLPVGGHFTVNGTPNPAASVNR
jgi:hypothetical protein